MRRASSILGLVAALIAGAAPAAAATVGFSGGVITFTAGPGEINQVFVSFDKDVLGPPVPGQAFLFSDPAGLTTTDGPGGCSTQRLAGYVACPVTAAPRIVVDLGDRNDVFSVGPHPAGTSLVVRGGDGDDRLGGTSGGDTFDGGPGDDLMIGDGYYLSGVNQLGYAIHGADDFTGGPGTDFVSYLNHEGTSGVTVTLDNVANDGDSGEGDNVRSDVENLEAPAGKPARFTGNAAANTLLGGSGPDILIGGDGNDVIRASAGNDDLNGGPGDDTLEGGAEDDTLDGGPGTDSFSGDATGGVLQVVTGNDTILARDGVAEQISCGPGSDRVTADASDTVAKDGQNVCETVDTSGAATPPAGGGGGGEALRSVKALRLAQMKAAGLTATVRCATACRLTGTARIPAAVAAALGVKPVIATGGRTLLAPGTTRVTVRLTAAARRKLVLRGPLVLTFEVRRTDAARKVTTLRTKVTLRP